MFFFVLKGNKTEDSVVKGKFIAYILSRNCPLKHVPEGKMKERGIRGRRCKLLLDDLKDTRRY